MAIAMHIKRDNCDFDSRLARFSMVAFITEDYFEKRFFFSLFTICTSFVNCCSQKETNEEKYFDMKEFPL